jgi:hypothetical protein
LAPRRRPRERCRPTTAARKARAGTARRKRRRIEPAADPTDRCMSRLAGSVQGDPGSAVARGAQRGRSTLRGGRVGCANVCRRSRRLHAPLGSSANLLNRLPGAIRRGRRGRPRGRGRPRRVGSRGSAWRRGFMCDRKRMSSWAPLSEACPPHFTHACVLCETCWFEGVEGATRHARHESTAIAYMARHASQVHTYRSRRPRGRGPPAAGCGTPGVPGGPPGRHG